MGEFAEGVWECAEFIVVKFQSLKGRELREIECIKRGKFSVGDIEQCEGVGCLQWRARSEFEECDIIVGGIQN
jgi:hypothetical protein